VVVVVVVAVQQHWKPAEVKSVIAPLEPSAWPGQLYVAVQPHPLSMMKRSQSGTVVVVVVVVFSVQQHLYPSEPSSLTKPLEPGVWPGQLYMAVQPHPLVARYWLQAMPVAAGAGRVDVTSVSLSSSSSSSDSMVVVIWGVVFVIDDVVVVTVIVVTVVIIVVVVA
jgi:hypothetical protein